MSKPNSSWFKSPPRLDLHLMKPFLGPVISVRAPSLRAMTLSLSLALAGCMVLVPRAAEAYIGPGAGLAAIGTAIALVGAVLLAIAGFVWYPIKRLRARWKNSKNTEKDSEGPRSR